MCVVRPKCEIKSSLSLTARILYVCGATGARSLDSPRVLRQVQVPKKHPKISHRQVTLGSLLINFVPQMPANAAAVCNPTGALPSACALFLATLHLFVRHCTAREKKKDKSQMAPPLFFCECVSDVQV